MEIGSEYNLPLSELSIKEKDCYSYLTEYQFLCSFDSGRSALRHFVSFMDFDGRVLMPEFICESVLNCFRTENIVFYKLNNDFTIDIEDLELKLKKIYGHISVIFLMHYFGTLQPKGVLDIIKSFAEKYNCYIVEDTTHSIFSSKGTIGDYQICSIRKWLPIPSGGLLYSNKDLLHIFDNVNYSKSIDNNRSYAMILKDLFLNQGLNCNNEYRRIFVECEDVLDRKTDIFLISDFSRFVASCVDIEELIYKRRSNYRYLRKSLQQIGINCAVQMRENDCPLVLPIMVNSRNEFRSYLINNKVYCAVHWPFDGLRQDDRKFASYCSDNLLSLPIDQRYGKDDMDYLIEVILKYGEVLSC